MINLIGLNQKWILIDAFYISCTYTELLVALHEMKRDLISFIEGPCFDYLARFNLKYANNMINHLKKLLIDVKINRI